MFVHFLQNRHLQKRKPRHCKNSEINFQKTLLTLALRASESQKKSSYDLRAIRRASKHPK